MSLPVRLRPEAERELADARQWYEAQRPGLGAAFVTEVERVVGMVGRSPLLFPRVHGDVRRAMVHRFPYGLFYRPSATEVVVVACYQLRRRPRPWRGRLR